MTPSIRGYAVPRRLALRAEPGGFGIAAELGACFGSMPESGLRRLGDEASKELDSLNYLWHCPRASVRAR